MHGFDTIYHLSNRPVKDQSASLKFKKSVTDPDREFLVTLRIINKNGEIVGYANGGRLENFTLRRGTHDDYYRADVNNLLISTSEAKIGNNLY
jgi:hypothetical protein